MDGIKIPVEAKLDSGDTDQQLQHWLSQFNALGEAIAKANKVKFQPVDKASIEQVKQLHANYASLLKVSGELRKRLIATGQGSTDFLNIDWSKTHPDEGARQRAMLKSFQYVTGGTLMSGPVGPAAPPPGAPPPAGPPGSAPPASAPPPPPARPPSQLAKIANATGSVGQIATTAAGEGMQFGATAGLMGLAGGIAALGVAKLVGMVSAKVGNAQQELIGYDTLKRSLGDVNVSFGMLQESLRNTARDLDATFDETLRYGTTFTRLAGLTGDDSKKLGGEVSNAGGFGRSFGMDLNKSTAFFAQQRMYGVTRNVEDSRRLGLMIGEGLAKANVFSKADEVLESISAFVENQTRQGMQSANVGGYASFLTGMMGSGIPGTDPSSAAAILARVNAAIGAGGANGEAGQNFMYSALGSRLGLNPLQTGILREQGAFGTGERTFGKDSLYGSFMGAFGGQQANAGAQGSTATNLQMLMEHFQRVYKGRPELMANAMSQTFGTTMSQSMALAMIQKEHGGKTLGGLGDRLQRLGVNVNDVNMKGLARLGSIEADPSLSEEEKDKRIKAAASQNQEETDGSRTRATINGVERAVQKMATSLVTPLNDIRGAVMYMAGEGGNKSPREIMETIAKSESDDRLRSIGAELDPQIEAAQRSENEAREKALNLSIKNRKPGHAEEQDPARARMISELEAQEQLAQERITALKKQKADAIAEEMRRRYGELADLSRAPVAVAQTADWAAGGAGGGRGRVNPDTAFQLSPGDMGEPLSPFKNKRKSARAPDSGLAPGSDAVSAARDEGLSGEQTRLMMSIYGQESSADPDAPTSNRGAVGGMQMMPDTFKRFADPGWDINNPEHNRRAAARYIKYLWGKSGGNAGTTAGAYYGGEGVIGPGGTLKERRDPVNPNNPSTLEYRGQVLSRMRAGSGTPLPDVMSKEEAEKARAASATPMPADQRKEAGAGRGSVNPPEVKVSGTFHLIGADGQPRATPLDTTARVALPSPSGSA